jgi:hypothetical protein
LSRRILMLRIGSVSPRRCKDLTTYDGAAELRQRGIALHPNFAEAHGNWAAISGGRATWLARWNRAAEPSI